MINIKKSPYMERITEERTNTCPFFICWLRNTNLMKYKILHIFLLILGLPVFLSYFRLYKNSSRITITASAHSKNFLIENDEDMACKIPKLKPFGPLILPLIEPPPDIRCASVEYPLIFELDDDSSLVQLTNYETHRIEYCCYSSFTRLKKSDLGITVEKKCTRINETITTLPQNISNILIYCKHTETGEINVTDVFSLPRLSPIEILHRTRNKYKDQASKNLPESEEEPKLNVVILGLDAVSNMNFQRTMFRSHDYLQRKLNALTFDGYTKLGDNTLPNMMAVLTGYSLQEIEKTYWKSPYDNFDDCPFIWKNFSEKGYFTSFAEDNVYASTFNYMKEGFKNPPVDFYARPSLLALSEHVGHETPNESNLCYGPRFAFDVMLKFLRNIAYSVRINSNKKITRDHVTGENLTSPKFNYFQYIWANSIFHDFDDHPTLGDKSLKETLEWLHTNNYLNDTVLIVMSDHGIRWGKMRETLQGKLEERMPLLNIVLPTWFPAKYPAAYGNMVINKQRLSSHFDLHETLKDILYPGNLTNENIQRRTEILDASFSKSNRAGKFKKVPRGISLFLPIPRSRDCEDAGIDKHWCVCHTTKVVNTSLIQVQEAAREVIKHINGKLVNFRSCMKLELDAILSAQVVIKVEKVEQVTKISKNHTEDSCEEEIDTAKVEKEKEKKASSLLDEILKLNDTEILRQKRKFQNLKVYFDITLKSVRGGAMFEASVEKDVDVFTWKVIGDVSRINMYGNQSHCVQDSKIKLYCFCKEQE